MTLETPDLLAVGDRWVAVAKPAGVPVVPARGEGADDCLRARVEAALGARVWVVHRLDRETSGVVVFARDAEAHRALSLAFERREVDKTYLAWVLDPGLPEAGRIDVPLHPARRGKSRPARPGEPGARPAATAFRATARWRLPALAVARLELLPETGRHHQLRVHLRSRDAPILGDRLYAHGPAARLPAEAGCSRLALHALRLSVPDPDGGAPPAFEAPLPADLAALEDWLERTAVAAALR
jgi:tRNA pseudouridine32 synthase/23S rRNA pseudouridine746 synthase